MSYRPLRFRAWTDVQRRCGIVQLSGRFGLRFSTRSPFSRLGTRISPVSRAWTRSGPARQYSVATQQQWELCAGENGHYWKANTAVAPSEDALEQPSRTGVGSAYDAEYVDIQFASHDVKLGTGSETDHMSSAEAQKDVTTSGETTEEPATASLELPPMNAVVDPLAVYESHIIARLEYASGLPAASFATVLQRSDNLKKDGDLKISIPAIQTAHSQSATMEDAERWLQQWKPSALVHKPIKEGSSLKFYLRPESLITRSVTTIMKQGKAYGQNMAAGINEEGNRKKVLIDFSSPNIAKPFHAGHLRSTVLGSFIANLYQARGWEVTRLNYLGDWGTQFGLLAVGVDRYGESYPLEKDPIRSLYDIYVRINKDAENESKTGAEKTITSVSDTGSLEDQSSLADSKGKAELETQESATQQPAEPIQEQARAIFRKLQNGDHDAKRVWQWIRDLSIKAYKQTYSRLNIHFDVYSGESEVSRGKVREVVSKLRESGHCRDDHGGLVIDFSTIPGATNLRPTILQKRDGASVYLGRDIAAALSRHETYQFDKMLYVVGMQQQTHLQQVFAALSVINSAIASKCSHIMFGMIEGMSTRKGTAIFLNDILDDASDKCYEIIIQDPQKNRHVDSPQGVADGLGISSVVIQDMKSKRKTGYRFNLERMTASVGDTGPYLQYTHARLCSIRERAALGDEDWMTADLSLLRERIAVDLIRLLIQWPGVVERAAAHHEPSVVVTYLFRLAHLVNAGYNRLWVIDQEHEVKKARMALYSAVRQVLSNALNLLGLEPVERM